MTVLVVQIPCYNEADTLAGAIADVPRHIPGVDSVIILVVDDGSNDGTTRIALDSGADYVVLHRQNRGLAQAFMTGLTTALALGADIIVNTDADQQYPGRYIPNLVAPLLSGKADLAIGDRQPGVNLHFSPVKRVLELLGSWIIRRLSQTDAPDAPSGFRAYSRYAALRMHVYNRYSYTLETLIQVGRERMALVHIPIETNPPTRPSRLHTGILNFIWRQSGAIIRSYVLYLPLRSFSLLGLPFLATGGYFIGRFIFFYLTGAAGLARHIQSVSIGGTIFIFGMLLVFLGLLGDAMRANRKMMEEVLLHLRNSKYNDTDDENFEINGNPVLRKRK
jgi:glycosyltransferase involved in cell wall biosynthesis